MLAATSRFWQNLLQMHHTPSEAARQDAQEVFARIQRQTAGLLPDYIVDALRVKNLISDENIKAAIRDLSRGSTPGTDGIPLEFYLLHLDRVAPLLSRLFQQVLERGRLTPDMAKAILSPIYKDKGSPSDPAMYRPIRAPVVGSMSFALIILCSQGIRSCKIAPLNERSFEKV